MTKYKWSKESVVSCTKCGSSPVLRTKSGWAKVWRLNALNINITRCRCGIFTIDPAGIKVINNVFYEVVPKVIELSRPCLTVDVVVSSQDKDPRVLFVKRGPRTNPEKYRGCYALPGGHVENYERVKDAAVRELMEETGLQIKSDDLTLLKLADSPDRDPRKHAISVVYQATLTEFKPQPMDDTEVSEVCIVPFSQLRRHEVAFDHYDIIRELMTDISNNENI